MAHLIGVYRGTRGPLYPLSRFLGAYSCDLARLSENRTGISPAWKAMVDRLTADGHSHELVSSKTASVALSQASAGREPCILIDDDHGDVAMIADWNDLSLADGDIERYERILRSKLLMY